MTSSTNTNARQLVTFTLDYIFGAGTDAPQAINHTPKVVLLDLKLPKVDGLEVLRRLKGDERRACRWWS